MNAREIIDQVNTRIKDDLPLQDFQVILKVSGGPPTQRIISTVEIKNGEEILINDEDELHGTQETNAGYFSKKEKEDFINCLKDCIYELLSFEKPKFVPDSLVGSIRLTFENRSETLYFEGEIFLDDEPEENLKARKPALLELKQFVNQVKLNLKKEKR